MLVVIPVVLVKAESGYAVKPHHPMPNIKSVSRVRTRRSAPTRSIFHRVHKRIRVEHSVSTGGRSGHPLHRVFASDSQTYRQRGQYRFIINKTKQRHERSGVFGEGLRHKRPGELA